MLFSGDHIMQGSTVVISPPDGNMADYLDSLATVRALRLRSIAPGHGHLIEEPRAAIDDYIEHRQAREQQILDLLATSGTTKIDDLVEVIYVDVDPRAAPGGQAHRARPPAQAGQGGQGQGPLHRRQVERGRRLQRGRRHDRPGCRRRREAADEGQLAGQVEQVAAFFAAFGLARQAQVLEVGEGLALGHVAPRALAEQRLA